LCANFNETEFEKTQNDILINEINKNLEDNEVADDSEESEPISDAQVQESAATTATQTTISTTTALSIEEKQLDITITTSTTTSTAEDDNLPVDSRPVDNRLLYYYCELEGFMLEIMFGRADANSDSDSAKIMLAILIISCCVSVFYLLSSCLAFYAAKKFSGY